MTIPTVGSSEGTWGQEINDHLGVSLDSSTGKIKINGLTDDEGQYYAADVNGSATKVYTKFITGTTDADTSTDIEHGVDVAGGDTILHVSAAVYSSVDSLYKVYDYDISSASATVGYRLNYDGTYVYIRDVESTLQGQSYVLKIEYIV